MITGLSVGNYLYGMGGFILLLILVQAVVFWRHVNKNNLNNPIQEMIAMVYIGIMFGLMLWFITIPTLCFLRSTYLCYQVM